eukprot:2372844-Rhodomonas_salina.1
MDSTVRHGLHVRTPGQTQTRRRRTRSPADLSMLEGAAGGNTPKDQKLLAYHIQLFRRGALSTTAVSSSIPKVIRARNKRVGVGVETHSFLDDSPPMLSHLLVKVETQSLKYAEVIADATGVSYQGVTTVGQTGTTKLWEIDCMRWHQMLVDCIVSNYEQIDSHHAEMQKSEKRGYRTLSWVVMNYLTTKCQLESSLGEQLFGSYPSLQVVHDRDEWSVHGCGRAWLFLDAIAPMSADAWLQLLLEGGGGLVAS